MSSTLDSKNLIESIKNRSFIPIDQKTFSDKRLLEMATEEINIAIMEKILTARGDYLVYYKDVPLTDANEYEIPNRAHGDKLRDAAIINERGEIESELTQIDLEQLVDSNHDYNVRNSALFYLQNNTLVICGNQLARQNRSLRMYFYMRPNALVTNDRAGTISQITSALEIDTIVPVSGTISGITQGAAGKVLITSTAHNLSTGSKVTLSGTNSVPVIDGIYEVTSIDANTISIDAPAITANGTTGSWKRMVEVSVISMATMPKHFNSSITFDIVGAKSPNKIKSYDMVPNNVSLAAKTVSIRTIDLNAAKGDYITQAEETIVPNLPTEFHPVVAQLTAVACLEAMQDEQGKQSAERKLATMMAAVLKIITNRVEGAPKKIKKRHGCLNQAVKTSSRREY